MKKLFTILIIAVCILSCDRKSESVTDLEQYVKSHPTKSYFYFIVLTMTVPTVKTDSNLEKYFEWDVRIQVSDIQELHELSEDETYKYLDEYSNIVSKETLQPANSNLQTASSIYGIDTTGREARIVKRKMHKFNTYKEASVAREQIFNDPDKYSQENNHD